MKNLDMFLPLRWMGGIRRNLTDLGEAEIWLKSTGWVLISTEGRGCRVGIPQASPLLVGDPP